MTQIIHLSHVHDSIITGKTECHFLPIPHTSTPPQIQRDMESAAQRPGTIRKQATDRGLTTFKYSSTSLNTGPHPQNKHPHQEMSSGSLLILRSHSTFCQLFLITFLKQSTADSSFTFTSMSVNLLSRKFLHLSLSLRTCTLPNVIGQLLC